MNAGVLPRLNIALIAPPWYPLPPRGYGGVELVVTLLARELRRQGHRVTLFGAEGSEPGITVCAPAGLDAHLGQATQVMYEMTYLARVVRRMRAMAPFDVIHDHAGFGGAMVASLLQGSPVLHTVHGAIGVADLDFYNSLPGDVGLVALSESQRRQAPDLGWIGVVHNAVDVRHLTVAHPDLDPRYLLCLARICEDKGQHVAIAVARRCGLRLVLAGKVEETPQGREYFHRKVEPYIDGTNVIYIPSVTAAAKARLIARATAMLAPISWPEPFGLSIVEAMVSGTPAISLRRGAAAELIEEGVTGFVVDDEDNMLAAVGRVGEIDAIECARVARERFSPEVMTNGYVRVYRRALDRPLGAADDQATGNLPVNGGGFVGPTDRLPEMVPDSAAGGSWASSSLARGYQPVGLRPAPRFCGMKPSKIASIGGLGADSTTRSWTIAPAQREAMPVRNSTVSSVVAGLLEESAPTRG